MSPGPFTPGHDPKLEHINKFIEDARRRMLSHDPGTQAQEQAWAELKNLLRRKNLGDVWIPKF